MANMSYCRFENTAKDLADCVSEFNEELGAREHNARKRIIVMMIQALEEIGCSVDSSGIDTDLITSKLD